MAVEFVPVGASVGAFVEGVDIGSLTGSDAAAIDAAWNEYGVLFFRDQDISPDQHLAFAEQFSAIDVNRFFQPVPSHPQIAEVRKEADQIVNIGGGWHTDHSYDQEPARGSILVARELPNAGGDTHFLHVGDAYDALSNGLKATLETLQAVHSNERVFGRQGGYANRSEGRLGNPDGVGSAIHPVVILHPVTGRKLLYVNAAFTLHFVGWTREESKPLLDYLYTHMIQPQFVTEFDWKPGSVAMWDNRSTWHYALNDYHGDRRLMHRITIEGGPLRAAA